MKKISILFAIMIFALSIASKSQLNYLFSATSRPYVPVTGGTIPHLISYQPNYELSDEGFATIPIGFNFNYNGVSYKDVDVSINGFITLGNPINSNYILFRNFLANGPRFNFDARPVIAAFWDDLYLVDTANLVYKTTGRAPFRVFTIEWKKARWSYDAPAPVLSVELKLYETTNIIEFHYKDEGGTPFKQFAFASIGITSVDCYRDFISLQSTSSYPGISVVKAMDSLTEKPANNQVYRFVPAFLKAPSNFRRNYSYTDKNVSAYFQSGRFSSYEYAVTQSPVAPSSGTTTFLPNVTISSLSPATTYYIYERSRLFGYLYSQWACDSFTTSIAPASVPYMLQVDPSQSFIGVPEGTRTQDFQDTTFYYGSQQFVWLAGTDYPNQGDNLIYYNKVQGFFDNDTWLFTKGLHLAGGKTYRLKFSYFTLYYNDPGELGSLEIKYGTGAGFKGMSSGLLFKKSDISGNDPQVDTTIEFTPDRTQVYYFGLHDFTAANEGSPIILNFTVDEKAEIPITLNGSTNNTDNFLSWKINEPENVSNIQVQGSSNGMNFAKIGIISPEITIRKSAIRNPSFLKVDRKTDLAIFPNGNEGKSKRIAEKNIAMSGLHPEIQKRITVKNSSQAGLADSKYKFIDRNAKGMNYYRLQYADKNGKVSYSNIVVLNNSITSGLRIYPNPANEVLNVKIPLGTNREMTLLVTDVSGRTILSKPIRGIKTETNLQLDVSRFNAGSYFIKIICEKGCENAVMKFEKK